MRKLNVTILVGALVALLGAALVFAYGRNVDERVAQGRETVGVLVASQPLNAGTLAEGLSPSVRLEQVPAAFVPTEALSDLGDVAGLELLGPVPEGGYLSRAQFGSSQGADVVRPQEGKVALAVGVGITPGVARYVGPQSVVDLFVTYTGGGEQAANRTKLFHSGARVLSVQVAPPAGAEDGEQAGGASAAEVIAVLEVTPEEAERIVNATTLGSLYLALSSEGQEHRTGGGAVPDSVVRSTA